MYIPLKNCRLKWLADIANSSDSLPRAFIIRASPPFVSVILSVVVNKGIDSGVISHQTFNVHNSEGVRSDVAGTKCPH